MVRRRTIAAAAVLCLLASLGLRTPAARASVVRGMPAPEIDARAVDSDASVLLQGLRGRCVLLEFFGTECPHCLRLAPRMNELHARYASRGLTVLGVSSDSPASIARFVREQGVRHAVARVVLDVLRAYEVTSYPLGLLIAPDGRVLWRGSFDRLTDRVLDAYLARVRVLPDVPPSFAYLQTRLAAEAYGAVERDLDRLRACRRLDERDCAFVLATLAWIDWQRQQAWAHAAEDERQGRWMDAHETYAALEVSYAGTETATRAQAARGRLLLEAGRAREIRAWLALERARRAGRWQPSERARSLLEAVASQHPGTTAAGEASALIRRGP